ncbi:MAG: helix-turn-helix transcriptional regulator [Planctomycetes bacterium]|jgi:AraC-like DNA-binding protein|nr:helix-turn-helix transcriptional regulator [Planctomycetota bacterium]
MNKFTTLLRRLGDWINAAPDAGLFFAETDLIPPIKTAPQPLIELMLAIRGDQPFTVYGGPGIRPLTQVIAQGEVALVSAHQGNHGPATQVGNRYACISFIVPRVLADVVDGQHPVLLRSRAGDPATLLPHLREVAQIHRAPPRALPGFQRKAALLRLIAATYAECSGDDLAATGDERVRRAQRLICDRLADPDLALDDLARVSGLSINHLTRCFRDEFGQTPIQYVMHLRLERARDLLRQSALSIKQIAHLAGFRDQGYFTRQFTRAVGHAPSVFRTLPLVKGGCGEFRPPEA